MKTVYAIVAIAIALVLGAFAQARLGWFGPDSTLATPSAGLDSQPEVLYWVAPMDSNFRRDQPGKSPMGMDLVPVYAGQAPAAEAGTVRISSTVEHNLGVRTALVEQGKLWRRMNATGRVEVDDARVSHVHVRTAGWIERLNVNREGDPVRQGQTLFELYAPELISAQREYLAVLRRNNAALTAAARENLIALGMNRAQVADLGKRREPLPTIAIVAPRDGYLIELDVAEGMRVSPASKVMSIADLSSVWVVANLPERYAAWLQAQLPAEATLTAYPGERFEGSVDYVYPLIDDPTRSLRARIAFDNADLRLKPSMYAKVSIYGGAQADTLSIPREALIRSGQFDRVVVAMGEGRYRVQEVQAGMESGQWVEIKRGLDAGDRVVTSAQFLLDSEASLSGSIHRLSDHSGHRERDVSEPAP